MEETRVYSCPSCGAPMKYSISNEKLKCRFCSNTYDLEYIRTHFTEVTDEKLSDFDWIDRTKYVWDLMIRNISKNLTVLPAEGKYQQKLITEQLSVRSVSMML